MYHKSLKKDLRVEALLELMVLRTSTLTQILNLLVQQSSQQSNSNNRKKKKRRDVAEDRLFCNNMNRVYLIYGIVYDLLLCRFALFLAHKILSSFFSSNYVAR